MNPLLFLIIVFLVAFCIVTIINSFSDPDSLPTPLKVARGTVGMFRASDRYSEIRRMDLKKWDRKYKTRPRYPCSQRVVISLTSTPDRLVKLPKTLCALLDQTFRVDEILLCLPKVSMKGVPYEIPSYLKDLENVRIVECKEDVGPGTKLFYSLQNEEPDTRIIVVDDDTTYGSKLVETLLNEFEKDPTRAVSSEGFIVIANYKLDHGFDRFLMTFDRPMEMKILQGYGGFVVTPKLFPKEVFSLPDAEKWLKVVDDIWWSGWLQFNGTKIQKPNFCSKNYSLPDFSEVKAGKGLSQTVNKTDDNNIRAVRWFAETHGVNWF